MIPVMERSAQASENRTRYPASEAQRKRPLRFWEIDRFFKCPVVGMCLTLAEQKQVLKKSGVSLKQKGSFEIHETLVASSENENRLSRKVDTFLHRKFSKTATALLDLNPAAFHAHFNAAFETGNDFGMLWAAAVHPGLPTATKRSIFGKIHMTMHWSAEQCTKMKQKLTRQKNALEELRRNSKETARLRRALLKENKDLRRRDADSRSALTAAERENASLAAAIAARDKGFHLTEMDQKNRRLKEAVDALRVEVAEKQAQITSLQEKVLQLSSEIERQRDANRRYQREALEIIDKSMHSTAVMQPVRRSICARNAF